VNPVEPKQPHAGAVLVVFAKDQPQYTPLPAAVGRDGLVMTEWEFTAEELARVVNGGRVRLWIYTFGHPLQPVQLEVVE
jgi:hypothetical protein